MVALSFDKSGKVIPPSADELAQEDQNTAIIGLVRGTMQDGRPFYAYVAIMPSKYHEFHAMTSARMPLVIDKYGAVIAAGFEAEPPPEVAIEMNQKYGCDEHFEENLRRDALGQQQVHFKKQEEVRINDIVALLKKNKA